MITSVNFLYWLLLARDEILVPHLQYEFIDFVFELQ